MTALKPAIENSGLSLSTAPDFPFMGWVSWMDMRLQIGVDAAVVAAVVDTGSAGAPLQKNLSSILCRYSRLGASRNRITPYLRTLHMPYICCGCSSNGGYETQGLARYP